MSRRINRPRYLELALFIVLLSTASGLSAQSKTLIGTVALRSHWGRVLQCHCDGRDNGELHASNEKINQEETWHLYQIGDPKDHKSPWRIGEIIIG